jgi:hypothetical protein
MGFFSKTFKKIKKGFKSAFKNIGKAVKKVFKGFGKFMGKIGIVGQLAMSFVLPGIGNALMKTAGSAFSGLTGALGASGNVILKSAGKMLEAGGNFAKMGHSAFKTVGEGISSFVSEMGHAALSQVPGIQNVFPDITDKKFSTAWNNVQEKFNDNANKVSTAFNDLIGNTKAMPTATQANVLAQNEAISGTGTTPSSVGEIGSTKDFKVPEIPDYDNTFEFSKPDMQTPKFEVEGAVLDKADINIPAPTVETKSLLDKGVDLAKEMTSEVKQSVLDFPSKLPDYAGEYVEGQLENKLTEAVLGDEEAPVGSYGSAGAAGYQQVDVGQYNSASMNDRAYQMALDPVGYGMQNPFGYASQDSYQQQMLQFTRPQYG